MKTINHLIFTIILVSIFFITSQSQPIITNVTFPDTVEQYDMIEIAFTIDFQGQADLNYYDPTDCNVFATFTNGYEIEQIIGFYFEDYDRISQTGPGPQDVVEQLDTNGTNGWRVRFTPEVEDNWTFTLTAKDPDTSTTTNSQNFYCEPSVRKGFIGISQPNNRYFEYSNGGNYLPIGQNVGWYYSINSDYTQPYGTHEYDHHIESLEAHGANYFRNWIGHYKYLSITPNYDYELGQFFYDSINQKDAWRMDYIVKKTANSNPRINIMPCFFTHQPFTPDPDNWNTQWEDTLNPYRYLPPYLPGTCENRWDFFTDSTAKQVTKNAIRYIVARWGYATNILAWELFNEVDHMYATSQGTENWDYMKAWHTEMYNYIKEIDDNHLISTSFGNSNDSLENQYVTEAMDFTQTHRYWDAIENIHQKFIVESFDVANDYLSLMPERPYLFGETDYIDAEESNDPLDRFGYQYHCLNFSSLFTGAVGVTAYWRWVRAFRLNYYQHFQPVSVFAQNLELFHDSYTYTFDKTAYDNDSIHLTYMVSENKEFVAGWGQHNNFEYNELLSDSNFLYLDSFLDYEPEGQPKYFPQGRIITLYGLNEGFYKLRWFSTMDGTCHDNETSIVYSVGDSVNIGVPARQNTPYGDFLFILDYDDEIFFRKHPYVFFQNEVDTQNGGYTPVIEQVVVQWHTNGSQTCKLDWGYTETYEFPEIFAQAGDHNLYFVNFLIDDVSPATKIYYKVSIMETSETFESSFITPPAVTSTDISFYAYGDTRGSSVGSPPPYHNEVCEQILNEVNLDNSSQTMLLHCGDWNTMDNELSWQTEYFNHFHENSIEMKSSIAVMGAYGNHEYPGEKYKKYWPYSYDDIEQEVDPFSYSYDYGPVHVTVIKLGSPSSEINEDHENWIINDLENTDKEWKIMLFHAPAYSNSFDNYHWNNEDGQDILQPLCEQYGVQVVIAGHNHYYAHWLVNGVHHLTLGGGGVETWYPYQIDSINIGELKAFKFNHFAKIDIVDDFMDITIVSREKENNNWVWKSDFDTFTLPTSLKICDGEDVTWDEDVTYADEIRVCSGSTLTIKSEVGFVKDGKLIVERGGKLIIDGGKVTSQDTILWEGIEVWGTASALQNPVEQGWVRVINNGVIENAKIGINAIKIDSQGGKENYNYNYTGGIVEAKGADFINNETAVRFYDYDNNSASSFYDCNFIVNDNYLSDDGPHYFIYFHNIHSIDITWCKFLNNSSNNCYGKGIYSFNSGFRVEGKCISGTTPCTAWDYGEFKDLKYGIYAISAGSINFPNIKHTMFSGNHRAIYFSALENGSVKSCSIYTGPNCNGASYGIYLDESTGYTIEENEFFEGNFDGIGLVVNKSGPAPNIIYNNIFNELFFAIVAQNENRAPDGTGLVLKCNEYNDNGRDEVVLWKEAELPNTAGIAETQGANLNEPDAPAGNRFSYTGPEGKATDIYNEANDIIYYYHVDLSAPLMPKYFTDQIVIPTANTWPNAYWNPEESCPPSNGGGGAIGGTGGIKSAMSSSGQKADSVLNIINMLKDGGNTEQMKTEVDISTPPETLTVYYELMNNSPYISDTVMEAAIDKEDVLPNVMIRDVMVANPHNAKDHALMEKIEERSNPMPEYMKAQILQGGSLVSVFENLQSNLAFYKQKRTIAFNALAKYYITDTIDPAASIDSLALLLENENILNAKYRLAFLRLNQGELTEGQNILSNITNEFNLTEDEFEVYIQLVDYYNLLANLTGENKTFMEADSLQIETLFGIEAMDAGKPSVFARNILLALGEITYDEPILMPDFLKSSAVHDEYIEMMKALEDHYNLKVFPNPAGDYLVLEHNLETEPKDAYVEIYNIKGEVVKHQSVAGLQNQQSVDIKGLIPGVYIATIYVNNNELESVKFTKTN